MSEETVDPNSRTSLAKRWWHLQKEDFSKKGIVATTVVNWAFMGLALYLQVIVPAFSVKEDPQIATLKADLNNAVTAKEAAESLAVQNQRGYEAASADKAKLSLDLDACRADPPAKEVDKATKHEASLTPTVKKVRTKPVLPPKADPTLYEQFVAWYEANVTPPGVN